MRVALDVRVRRGPRSSFVRVSELIEEAARAAELDWFPWESGACPADVLWSPLQDAEPAPPGLKRVLTLHDVSPLLRDPRPAAARLWRGWRFRRRVRRAAAVATHFAIVSEDARGRVATFFPELGGRASVVPLYAASVMRPLAPDAARPALHKLGLEPGFVLFVSALRPHKNWEGALRAWAGLPPALRAAHPLVMAGSAERWGGRALAQARELGVDLRLLGAQPDEALTALYSSCGVFIFPSYQEGFGLPPLEAMACGAPVVASHATAIPEVLGSAALYGDPWRPESFTAPLQRLLTDPVERAARVAASLARAKEFNSARTGRSMRDLLAQIA
jgi:glycosyltransferase involved in cell wall biosynthesis